MIVQFINKEQVEQYNEYINDGFVVVYFGADFVAHNRDIKTAINRLVPEYEGRSNFAYVDSLNLRVLLDNAGMSSVPGVAYFKDGKLLEADIITDIKNIKDIIKDKIESLINKKVSRAKKSS